jgi:hypothetical protein
VAGSKGVNPLFSSLRAADRSLLGLLYVAAAQKRADPRAVDDVARALIQLRVAERAAARPGSAGTPSLIPGARDEHSLPSTPAAAPSQAPSASAAEDSAEPTLASVRPRVGSGTYTRTSMIPSALPEHAALEAEPGHVLAAELATRDSLMPPTARSFGSASQLAARAAGSYRSLAPPPAAHLESAALAGAPGLSALATALSPERTLQTPRAAGQQANALPRPLDLGQALGLGALLDQARARKKLPKRLRMPAQDRSVHAVGPTHQAHSEADADDPLLNGTRRERRRVRWQLLIQRRKRARKRRA